MAAIANFMAWIAARMPYPRAADWIGFLAVLAMCMAVAVASYHLLEMPFLRLKKKFETKAVDVGPVS